MCAFVLGCGGWAVVAGMGREGEGFRGEGLF